MSSSLHLHLLGPLPALLVGEITSPVQRVRTPTGDEMWLVSDWPVVSDAAHACADMWQKFAEQLERQ